MEISEFIEKEVVKHIDDLVRNKDRNASLNRSEEAGLFTIKKDYETEIKNNINKGDLVAAKGIYKELLGKFDSKLDRDVAIRLLSILSKVTDNIKKDIKDPAQEKLFEEEFEKYNKIVTTNNIIPQEIKGEETNAKFFEDKEFKERAPKRKSEKEIIQAYIVNQPEGLQPELPINQPQQKQKKKEQEIPEQNKQEQAQLRNPPQAPNYPNYAPQAPMRRYINYENVDPSEPHIQALLKQIKTKEVMITKALIMQNLKLAKELYDEMKLMFEQFPSELYDIKIEIYSKLLSTNYKIHQLVNHINRLKKIEEENNKFELKHDEITDAKEQKLNLEKEKIKGEIEYLKKDINPDILRKEEITRKNRKLEIKKLKNKDNNIELDIEKPTTHQEARTETQKNHISKLNKELIKKLYNSGIKKFLDKDNKQAKDYFKRILEINPYYKPAIIRLEQINAQT